MPNSYNRFPINPTRREGKEAVKLKLTIPPWRRNRCKTADCYFRAGRDARQDTLKPYLTMNGFDKVVIMMVLLNVWKMTPVLVVPRVHMEMILLLIFQVDYRPLLWLGHVWIPDWACRNSLGSLGGPLMGGGVPWILGSDRVVILAVDDLKFKGGITLYVVFCCSNLKKLPA